MDCLKYIRHNALVRFLNSLIWVRHMAQLKFASVGSESESGSESVLVYSKGKHSTSLRWRHNRRDSVSNHEPYECLLNRLFRRRWKKTSKLRVTGLCVGNSPGTGEFPAQRASNAENVSIWWRHHVFAITIIQIQIMTFYLMVTIRYQNWFVYK